MVQPGLQESCWAEAVKCYGLLRDVQGPVTDGQTLYERRFKSPFDGPIVPFGAEVQLDPMSSKDLCVRFKGFFGEPLGSSDNPTWANFGKQNWR